MSALSTTSSSMFDMIMELPLFQGVSRKIISEIIEKVPFHFESYENGEQIISVGDHCNSLIFVMSGKVQIELPFANKRVRILEVVDAPTVLGYAYLYGQDKKMPYKVSAYGKCGVMRLTKMDYFNILQKDPIFLLNLMNMLSRVVQQSKGSSLSIARGTIQNRLAQMFQLSMHTGAHDLRLVFRQKDLCTLLGVQRTSLINALDGMQAEGIIEYSQMDIVVKDFEKLCSDLKPR